MVVMLALAGAPERVPVLLSDAAHVYVGWSGAHEGDRAVLVGPDGIPTDTLEVEWTRDAITALRKGARTHARDIANDWWAMPMAHGASTGTLTVPLFAEPATLDPALVTSLAEKQVAAQLFEGLVRFDAHLAPIPAAADSFWQEGPAWTFRLRRDARFHDGTPVRAKDVMRSIHRALAPATGAPRADGLADAIQGGRLYREGKAPRIAGFRIVDTLTVTVIGTKAPLLPELASPAAFLVPDDFDAAAPVGSGPFRWGKRDNDSIVLRGVDAKVDSLVSRRVDGPHDAALQYELGRIDVVPVRESDEKRLTGERIAQDEAATYYVGMNVRQPWLSKRANRRSLAASIDRAVAVRVLVPGRGRLARGLLPPAFGLPELADSAWRPGAAEARAWPAPPPALSFWVPEGSATGQRLAEFVQAALARRGMKLSIVVKPWAEFERAVSIGRADLFYLSWFADGPDPVSYVASMVESRRKGSGGNRTQYASAAVDAALAAARNAPTKARAQEALLRAERLALADAPLVPLFHSVNVVLTRPWVNGYVPDPLGAPRLDDVEVRRGH
jgi:ABC-type transport system substrate-binding protein